MFGLVIEAFEQSYVHSDHVTTVQALVLGLNAVRYCV